MAHRTLIALGMIAAASPLSATQTEPMSMAPAASENAQYCLKIEAVTGTRLEEVKCWTRAEWAYQDVDVDKEWAREGVAIISDGVRQPA